jgi:chromosomal replication initiator protein
LELPAHLELADAWREISAELRRLVGESTYEIWLAQLEARSWDGGTLVVEAPSSTQAWVAKRFARTLEGTVRSILGPAAHVAFTGGPAGTVGRGSVPASSGLAPLELTATGSLNPRYSFEQFVIGDGNRLAHGASLAVAELPGQAYNPLFLHAPPGLGKTHLLHAIGNYVRAFGETSTVLYTTVEAFTNHFISALNSRSIDRFKHAYRDVDVLLIDDVQFLASKARTEEEFFHTFNSLYETGRQLVLTCDRIPRQLLTLEERLRERFESGLVADIRPPDFATRLTILRKRAKLDRVPVSDPAVLELIADRVTDNIRALEGALIRVVAYHSLTQRPIDLELATTVLDGLLCARPKAPLSVEDVQAAVASHYQLTVSELVSPSRAARIAWPRQIAIHLARELTSCTLSGLGSAFGGRNHATVLHACKRVSERVAEDQQAAHEIEDLTQAIRRVEADRSC